MYIGRFVIIGPDVAAYRVSSRSFPNRELIDRGDRLTVRPTEAAEPTENPYIEYNAVRVIDDDQRAVLGNGSHVDPIAEKLSLGYPTRDALVMALLALDYEKDEYDTPRLAGVLDPDGSYIGIVRPDAVFVKQVTEPMLVGTYNRDQPEPYAFAMADAQTAATAAYEAAFEHPVCAAGLVVTDDGINTAIDNGDT